MRAADIKKLLKTEPFEPIRLGLSDGRSVLIKHPDQVVVSQHYLYVGLARLDTSPPLATPTSGDAIAKDWLWVNLLHVVTIEPHNKNNKRVGKRRRKS